MQILANFSLNFAYFLVCVYETGWFRIISLLALARSNSTFYEIYLKMQTSTASAYRCKYNVAEVNGEKYHKIPNSADEAVRSLQVENFLTDSIVCISILYQQCSSHVYRRNLGIWKLCCLSHCWAALGSVLAENAYTLNCTVPFGCIGIISLLDLLCQVAA